MLFKILISAIRGCAGHAPCDKRCVAGGDRAVAGGAAGDEPRSPGDAGRGAGHPPQEARDLQVRPDEEEDEGQVGAGGPSAHH